MSETVERHRSAFSRDWSKQLGAAVSDERAPWPRPEVAARPAGDEECPAAARRLAAKARNSGWRVAVVFSRGTTPHGAGWEPGPVVDAVSVRCLCRRGYALGYWRDGRWAFGLAVDFAEGVPFRIATAGELTALLASSDEKLRVDLSDGMT